MTRLNLLKRFFTGSDGEGDVVAVPEVDVTASVPPLKPRPGREREVAVVFRRENLGET